MPQGSGTIRRASLTTLSLCVLLLGPALSADAANRVALVIGNDTYAQVSDLQKAVNDARAMAEALETIGFEVIRAENVTRREMNRQLQRFTAQLGAGDEALFFFAGHGVEIDGRNYLLPTDIPAASPGQEDFVKAESIPEDQVLGMIRKRGTRVSILVLDACRDNPFPKAGTRSLGGTRGLVRATAPEGSFIMYSAGVGQTALDRLSDDDPDPNSVFTRSLIPLLKRPGLSLIDAARQVRRDVQALAATVPHDQRPAYYDEVTGDFFFAGRGEGSAPATLGPAAQVWAVTKDTESPAVLEAFIREFPDSAFVALAEARLEELREQRVALGVAAEDGAETSEAASPVTGAGGAPATAEGAVAPASTACDRAAGDPNDPEGLGLGPAPAEIDAETAIAACTAAVREDPGEHRFEYQLARALEASAEPDKAVAIYEALARDGYPSAIGNLALMHATGRGVPRDPAKAVDLVEKPARSGMGGAAAVLGFLYEHGRGVERDAAEAARWYRVAAEAGDPGAMVRLGVLSEDGLGVPQDHRAALTWFERAGDANAAAEMFALARRLDDGLDADRDPDRAAALVVAALGVDGTRIADRLHHSAAAWSRDFHRSLQRRLDAKGLLAGPVDGIYDEGTREAVQALAGRSAAGR